MFFSTLTSRLSDDLKQNGIAVAQADQYTHAITDSAGAAIAKFSNSRIPLRSRKRAAPP